MIEAPKQHVSEIRREIERTNALKGQRNKEQRTSVSLVNPILDVA